LVARLARGHLGFGATLCSGSQVSEDLISRYQIIQMSSCSTYRRNGQPEDEVRTKRAFLSCSMVETRKVHNQHQARWQPISASSRLASMQLVALHAVTAPSASHIECEGQNRASMFPPLPWLQPQRWPLDPRSKPSISSPSASSYTGDPMHRIAKPDATPVSGGGGAEGGDAWQKYISPVLGNID
jgi:hypothetical protein